MHPWRRIQDGSGLSDPGGRISRLGWGMAPLPHTVPKSPPQGAQSPNVTELEVQMKIWENSFMIWGSRRVVSLKRTLISSVLKEYIPVFQNSIGYQTRMSDLKICSLSVSHNHLIALLGVHGHGQLLVIFSELHYA